MRYASNFAQGDGLRFNQGLPATEGYSNFLWTLWMSVLHLLPVARGHIPLLVSLSAAGLLFANLALVWHLVRRLGGDETVAWWALGFCALSFPLVYWSLRGMEVALIAALLDAALLLALGLADRPSRGSKLALCATLALLVLVRDEALLPGLLFALFLLSRAPTRRLGLMVVASLAVVVAAHLAFRLAYYGAPLPNTYYLKLTGTPLLLRVARGVLATGRTCATELLLPLLLAAAALRGRRPERWFVAVLLGQQLLYSAWVGADAWEGLGFANRYVASVLPLLWVLAALGVKEVASPGRTWWARALSGAVLLRCASLAAGDLVGVGIGESSISDKLALLRQIPAPAWIPILIGGLGLALLALGRLPAPAIAASLWLSANGAPWLNAARHGIPLAQGDNRRALSGLHLAAALPKETRIAVTLAGNLPYYAGFITADLLGKNDPYIARLDSHLPFLPGHSKWDYLHSIEVYHPDLILEIWATGWQEEGRQIVNAGYRPTKEAVYVRAGFNPPGLSRFVTPM